MAQTINTNIASLTAQRNLASSQADAATSMQRLSSGLRINSAKDDAAGLAIASRLTSQINGLNQAVRNANDAVSVVQIAEGALVESGNILQRMRELAVQSANATNSSSDRSSLQTEVVQLKAELDRIATSTSFGETNLLDGTFTNKFFQVGADQGQTIGLSISSAKAADIGTSSALTFAGDFHSAQVSSSATQANNSSEIAAQTVTFQVGSTNTSFNIAADATAQTIASQVNANVDGIAATAKTVARLEVDAGAEASNKLDVDVNGVRLADIAFDDAAAFYNGLEAAVEANSALSHLTVNTDGANYVEIVDENGGDITFGIAAEDDSDTAVDIDVDAYSDTNANSGSSLDGIDGLTTLGYTTVTGDVDFTAEDSTLTYNLKSTVAQSATAGGVAGAANTNIAGTVASSTTTVNDISVASVSGANTAINVIDAALQTINDQRATLGATQNRLDQTVSNLTNVSENSQAARSRIMDADFAQETAALAKSQILQQAGISVLAQANAQPQNILALLQ